MTAFIWTISIIFVLITIWAFILGYFSYKLPIKKHGSWYSEDEKTSIEVPIPHIITLLFPIGLVIIILWELSSMSNPFTVLFMNQKKKREKSARLKKEVQDIIDGKKEL